jgi:hypothetical protein
MEGFTEAERISAAWSKLHALEKNSNTSSNKTPLDSHQHHRDRRVHDRDERKRIKRSRSRSQRKNYRQRSPSRDVKNIRGDERDKPSYSPYRGNPDIRKSPTYSPYRGRREKSPVIIRRSSERSGRPLSRSRSRSKSFDRHPSPEVLARLPPPPDPRRPDHDSRDDHRKYFNKSHLQERKYRSRSRSNERSRDSITQSAWSHDRFTAADYDRSTTTSLTLSHSFLVLRGVIFLKIIVHQVRNG